MAKCIMVKANGKDVMVVLPANRQVDLLKAREVLRAEHVSIEMECDFERLFPDTETGAMPPFGSLYKIPCYIDVSFAASSYIYFNAGGHAESIRMKVKDYFDVVDGRCADLSAPERQLAAH